MEQGSGFNDEFIRSLLLNLEYSDYNQFMELSYHVVMQSPSVIFRMNDAVENKIESIDGLIKYFESIEVYEKCTNLQKIKSMLLLNSSFDSDDI
jgi:hypothetical protein